ncbi:hypothetical protein Cme02nite_41510 [Catellatospora methionotrophica]|uniref:VapC45 PIN like domain-containing protein n=1 Tax=Catellatospora methionotrophica TaxID=121620 RepID=A0A8J3LHT3_9ACTN|nr:hypothetical protein [Catellatospora methionotrophica]GIG15819.1 hypothetical protein Cme02nite_41510 [Catellatospora methionotrophica]
MSASTPAPLLFFLDRGLGSRVVPQLLRAAGWQLTTMDERYGFEQSQAVADVDWIAEAAERDEVILCKDLAIARNPLEAEAVRRTSARIFGLANARLTGHDAGRLFLHHQAQIFTMAGRAEGPYVVAVAQDTIRRRRLQING